MSEKEENRVHCPRCSADGTVPPDRIGCALCYGTHIVRESVAVAYKERFKSKSPELGDVDTLVTDLIRDRQKADTSPQVVCPSCRYYHWVHNCPLCGGTRRVGDWLDSAYLLRQKDIASGSCTMWFFLIGIYVL